MSEPRYRVTAEMITVTAVGGYLAGRNGRMAHNLSHGALLPEGVTETQLAHLLENHMIEPVGPHPDTAEA